MRGGSTAEREQREFDRSRGAAKGKGRGERADVHSSKGKQQQRSVYSSTRPTSFGCISGQRQLYR